jgi:hypothetical protein
VASIFHLMEIVPYSKAHREAVERLNAKLSAAGSDWHFPAEERPRDAEQLPVWVESFVAVEGDEVYGGYILKHQEFFIEGHPLELADLQLPLSLGQVDSTMSHVSAALLFDVLRRSPCVYSLGLGSEQTKFAKLLTAAGWQHLTVPFYFSVKSPTRFARNIRLPPDKALLQKALRALGHVGLAGVALRLRQALASGSRRPSTLGTYHRVRDVSRADSFADELFEEHVTSYSLVGDRRASALNCLYPEDEAKYVRVVVENDEGVIGWAVLLDMTTRDHEYFGDMRVGALADCFAAPKAAPAVVAAVDKFLTERGVDIVVSNQLHPAWCEALAMAGYTEGPSNFFFYFSEDLGRQLAARPTWDRRIHLNRGDGEGPTYL